MALLNAQAPNVLGTAMTYSAVTASDTVLPGSNLYLHVTTGATNTGSVTIVVPGTAYGTARPDIGPVSIPINSDRHFGPLVNDLADPATGLITITFGGTLTGTTSALLQF
jgi:hypothetical protein